MGFNRTKMLALMTRSKDHLLMATRGKAESEIKKQVCILQVGFCESSL